MNLSILDLEEISFKDAFLKQLEIHKQIQQGVSSHTLILCEHPHTITLGRQAKIGNILDYKSIQDNNIDLVIGVNRGGDVTYHGPGQLIGYFIFDLKELGRDLGLFLERIQRVIINTLSSFGINAYTIKGLRGVWVNNQKIASIGIGVSKWISLHGFGLNINTDLQFFDLIRPCGLDIKMTSLKEYLGRTLDLNEIKKQLVRQIFNIFEVYPYLHLRGASNCW